MMFQDRADAGRQLAQRLTPYRDENPYVFGLPRGGVVVAREVARHLDAPLDVIVARKLGAPMQPELGIGAIAPGGVRVLDERTVRYLDIPGEQIDRIVERETGEMDRRLRLYRGDAPFPDVSGCTAIVVDDGLATGVTARAAVRSIRLHHPRRILLAAPVCAPESAASFRTEVDEVVCVEAPADFRAVGLWYDNFEQTTDEEVIALLRKR
jgi:putative phosphoribosyl transferase